jgi:hypothetical protein
MEEGYALRDVLFLQISLSILMGILGVLWIFLLPKKNYKYKHFLVGIYFSPLVIGICFFGWMVFESFYLSHK